MFYVHGESLTDKAMRVFADDMKAIGRNDLVERVHSVQHQAALLESGYGDYWIILPDKTAILWRWQSLDHILKWKVIDFPAHECTDYRTVSGGCAGVAIFLGGVSESTNTTLRRCCASGFEGTVLVRQEHGLVRVQGGRRPIVSRTNPFAANGPTVASERIEMVGSTDLAPNNPTELAALPLLHWSSCF
jgi:hypothetical protein